MKGLNQHLEFQVKLAGGKTGGGTQGMSNGSNDRMPGYQGTVPDDVPDIGMMVPIEHVVD